MNKLNVQIDLSKIDRTRIKERRYTDKNGHEVIEKNYSVDLVELKAPKTVKEGDGWEMVKTHFVCEAQTKEERTARKETKYMGSGFQFVDRKRQNTDDALGYEDSHDSIDPNHIKF